MMLQRVTIVGLGWLGLPLYRRLERSGMLVAGTKRKLDDLERLRSKGIRAHQLELDGIHDLSVGDWFDGDFLIINIPPGRRHPNVLERYPKQVQQLLDLAREKLVKHIIFVSSTSVFGAAKGLVDDDAPLNPETDSGRALERCEQMIAEAGGVVVRFGGLYGPDRHPGRFFAGRTDAPEGDAPVNFIHQNDAVGVIEHVISHFEAGLRINAAAPAHPPKKEFYHRAALDYGGHPPEFLSGGSDGKVIECNWLNRTGYTFVHPDLDFAGCGGETD